MTREQMIDKAVTTALFPEGKTNRLARAYEGLFQFAVKHKDIGAMRSSHEYRSICAEFRRIVDQPARHRHYYDVRTNSTTFLYCAKCGEVPTDLLGQ